jgi:class 3 adenylate cyclase
LRSGIALGPALQRAGDYYGHSVNLASRVTGIARAASVLCTQEVRDAAPDDYEWSFAGRHRLKGLPEPVPLHRARRRSDPAVDQARPGSDGSGKEERASVAAKRRRGDRRQKRAAS